MPNRIISIIVTPKSTPSVEPVTLDKTKEWCIVGHDEDNGLLTDLITEVRKQAEAYTKNCLVDSSVELIINVCKPFELPRTPLKTITKVEIKNGTSYDELTTDDYEVLGEQFIPNKTGILRITYDAGYATDSLPQNIKLAILNEIAYRYDNRGDAEITAEISPAFERYLTPFINLAWQ